MATVEELKLRVRELENELIKCKQKQSAMDNAHNQEQHRPKIDKMSSEVVDSNPYRYFYIVLFHLLTGFSVCLLRDYAL